MPNALRRRPKQARSAATRDAIFEAAAQILERDGEAGFTTRRIAERAGVSVGTIYQYFSTKPSILAEMARRENARVHRELSAQIADGAVSPARLAIRAQIAVLKDRPATRRAALKAILAEEGSEGIEREARRTGRLLPRIGDELDSFILSKAVNGVIRAAVLEGSPHLADARLEDALVRLVEGYASA